MEKKNLLFESHKAQGKLIQFFRCKTNFILELAGMGSKSQ